MSTSDTAPLWSLTAAELVAGYRTGAFSPTAVMDAVFDRLDAVNPGLNAVIAVDREGATLAALDSTLRWENGAPLSVLDGVPISIKDNLYLAGLPATWGSRLHRDFVPDHDEPAVARLRAAGALLFGKTNVPEFTVQGYTGNLVFGTTFNPHARGMTPGGSTGGGAAAVAAGIGPLAIGTDAGGSIRRPAAHCGLFALKPSIGHVTRYDGFPQLLADFEVVGAIGRSAADLDSVREVLETFDPADPRTLATAAPARPFPAEPRIAFMPAIGANPVDPRIAAASRRIAAALAETGARVETIEAPFDADRVTAAWTAIMQAGLAWHLSKFEGWQALVNPSARALAEQGAARTAGELLDALAAAAEVRSAAGLFFRDYDLLLCPATAALAWPADTIFPPEIDGREVGPRGHAVFTGWMNVTGLPAVTVPVAMTDAQGGIGLQLVAGHGRDRDLLDFLATSPALRPFAPASLANPD
ncbi:amidase [Labrys monachus]|uniref:Aspartyl-tRNA(Asn)/glutamyl-tRNA(Gln) amidotransferase subunit A n=1 Tax=Labrys monachus TaxID=217067 RepID=A0ABU0FM51_9HYPH|nr:amidase [Labrys monachus]MDQ0395683.1 aspartyl-tRNA(Asn)/glutamyl-tRNA(Gln) amidotransferase subunit A [Labrys monachus]